MGGGVSAHEPVARSLRVDGRPARVLEAGSGPPVVLVHGLGLDADLWAPHLSGLAALGFRALAPDMPGFGHSDGPLTGLSTPDTAAWLGRLASALELERPAWVGHSIATQQLVRLAVAEPERVAALVLAAPTGRTGRHRLHQFLGLARTAFRERPGIVTGVLRRYLLGPVTTLGTWLRSTGHDTALDAPRVRAPTLLVLGQGDPVVPDEFGLLLLRLMPDAALERVEGAAHAVALDPAPTFTAAVGRFLARRYCPGVSTRRWKSSGMTSKFHGSSGP